jgi:hypothetical protein
VARGPFAGAPAWEGAARFGSAVVAEVRPRGGAYRRRLQVVVPVSDRKLRKATCKLRNAARLGAQCERSGWEVARKHACASYSISMTRSGWHPCQDKCARCARARIRSRVNCGRLCTRHSATGNYEKCPVKNVADYKSGLTWWSIAVDVRSRPRKVLYRRWLCWVIAALERRGKWWRKQLGVACWAAGRRVGTA